MNVSYCLVKVSSKSVNGVGLNGGGTLINKVKVFKALKGTLNLTRVGHKV